jgi:hypothetical protein
MKRIGGHAVVIGASMGGLLAARALVDFYGQVTVLERDAFPAADIPRKGVPQGKHAHGLLARGRSVIEESFPGWTDEVVGCGGVRGDIAIDIPWDIAVGNDLRHPQVQGPRSPKVRFINWYIGKLHMAARHDAVLANAFLKVANLTMSPAGLLHPSVVMRVIYGNIRRRSGANTQGSPESAG